MSVFCIGLLLGTCVFESSARLFSFRCLFARSMALSYFLLTSAFQRKPHAADVRFNLSPTTSKAFSCVLPSLTCLSTVSANNKSSTCDHASCLTITNVIQLLLQFLINYGNNIIYYI